MPNAFIQLNLRRPYGRSLPTGPEALRHVINLLEQVASGEIGSDGVQFDYNDSVAVTDATTAGPAVAVLVGSGLSGSVGPTIAGTAVTVTAAVGDTETMAAILAAIKANTTVNPVVSGSTYVMQMTLASVAAGTTVQVCGQTYTAVAAPANITEFGHYNIDGTDTADATALARAINRHPSHGGGVRATSAAGVVYVAWLDDKRPPPPWVRINSPSASTITVNVGVPTQAALCMIFSRAWGLSSREIRCTVSGTGLTVASANTGFLGGGSGGGTPTYTTFITP